MRITQKSRFRQTNVLSLSNMAGVNLRVANLRNANLMNCNLRAAVLAGADLEVKRSSFLPLNTKLNQLVRFQRCNLSGSDLQEANLRGANFKDAQLELMLTPLHMSQAIR